jgi:hypothetical protein
MKTTIVILFFLSVLFAGCEKNEIDIDKKLTDGFCIVSNDEVVLNHNDIEYYDYSTHLIYLKNNKSFADDIEGIGGFSVYADGDEIYSGQTQPGYSSFLPFGSVVINTHPSVYADYLIPISFLSVRDTLGNISPDPREDERIINALKKFDQFHAGLNCVIKSIHYSSSNNVKVELQLKNNDSFNYYYLDPDKMGIGLFHYFTNGLFIGDLENYYEFSHKEQHIQPESNKSWKKEWMSVIHGNETKTITIVYNNFEEVPNGQYNATFMFPGLRRVDKKDVVQNDGQIWLGKLYMSKEMTIE